jgi:hypothetical protein
MSEDKKAGHLISAKIRPETIYRSPLAIAAMCRVLVAIMPSHAGNINNYLLFKASGQANLNSSAHSRQIIGVSGT